jgi:HSP20 family protein
LAEAVAHRPVEKSNFSADRHEVLVLHQAVSFSALPLLAFIGGCSPRESLVLALERRFIMWNLMPWKNNNSMQGGLMTSDPFEREFSRIRDDFDQLIQRMWSGGPVLERTLDQRWGMDVEECEGHHTVRFEAPGFEADDFDVRMSGEHLLVKAEHKDSHEGNGGSNYRYGRFERSVPLPATSKIDQIDACYRNGILEVKIPKGEETQNVKRIAVKAG